MIPAPDYRLQRNSFGRLELTTADGETHVGVAPVRAFPISAPDDGIGLVDPHGVVLLDDIHAGIVVDIACGKRRRYSAMPGP